MLKWEGSAGGKILSTTVVLDWQSEKRHGQQQEPKQHQRHRPQLQYSEVGVSERAGTTKQPLRLAFRLGGEEAGGRTEQSLRW